MRSKAAQDHRSISANCIQMQLQSLSTSLNPTERHFSPNQSMPHVLPNITSTPHQAAAAPHLQLLLKQRGCKGCQSSGGEENDDLRMQRQGRTKKQTKTTHRPCTPCKMLASLGSLGPVHSCAGWFNEAGGFSRGRFDDHDPNIS